MKNKTIPAYSQKLQTYDILGDLKVSIVIKENPYHIPAEALFTMAARQNRKRGFLFVSKVLGKHIPVTPMVSLLAGAALAVRYLKVVYNRDMENAPSIIEGISTQKNLEKIYESLQQNPMELPEPTIFIGFAETATALGHSMFDCFKNNAVYIHTTRERIQQRQAILHFEEEHSHATTHRFYALNEKLLHSPYPVVLVDDEMTTGKTALNIIEAIQNICPRKEYTVVSLLDWRSEEDRRQFAEKEKVLGIRIHTVSLMTGEILAEGKPMDCDNRQQGEAAFTAEDRTLPQITVHKLQQKMNVFQPLLFSSIDTTGKENPHPYIKETGRFGITCQDKEQIDQQVEKAADYLRTLRKGRKTLCLGTGEFMFIPMKIAAHMGEGIKYHSTTRSPIYPCKKSGYGVQNAFCFESPDDPAITNYLYNIPFDHYDDLFLFMEREVPEERLKSMIGVLKELGIPQVHIVICMGNDDRLTRPAPIGSYHSDDVVFLLKGIENEIEEKETEDREEAIQEGVHYSEMLPMEYKPSSEYMNLFYQSLEESAEKLAVAVGVTAERIIEARGKDLVLVSLARAGTPIGILIKRYFQYRYGLDLPHYSISIIRGKGIDENALRYILKNHPNQSIQFIDGWTGKGAIAKVLTKACKDFEQKYGIRLNDELAVLADPGCCVTIYGTREDFLIPSSCLNATVSGLISRTVHRRDLIGENDFHGAKYYKELADEDVSYVFIDKIAALFPRTGDKVKQELDEIRKNFSLPTWSGWKDIENIQKVFQIDDINLIKPGIGETTRVLLRRIPWKVLIKDENSENLKHILLLAKDKHVPVERYPNMIYTCCGLIKPLGRGEA